MGFGFEGITDAETRNEIMDRAIDYLLPQQRLETQPTAGLLPLPAQAARGYKSIRSYSVERGADADRRNRAGPSTTTTATAARSPST